jgi:crotonobetainyl-CoA:carnitine CoA-transferase CaiB-like acyl-CoA transferase
VTDNASLPLSGIQVLDVTHVIAGPFATYQLALLGAEVTRVERIAGDDFVRYHGGTEEMKKQGLGASFLSQNACKRSIALNLKAPQGVEIFQRLSENVDIVMENFRPGVASRLGIGFSDIADRNSKVIYCSLSGFGATGPLAHAPAYDHIVQGMSGMMAMTGTDESGPMRVGFPIVDYIAGQNAVVAVLAALRHRDMNSAQAQNLNVPMLDSMVGIMGACVVDLETTGHLRGLQGNEAFSNSPFSGRFDTAEGQIVVTANTPGQAEQLCNLINRRDLKEFLAESSDSEGSTDAQAAIVREAVSQALIAATADEWEKLLGEAGVPAAKVRTLAETLAHPQINHNGLMKNLNVPEIEVCVQVPGLPIYTESWPDRSLQPVPKLGRDTSAVLRAAGYSEQDIAALKEDGVVA